MTEVFAKRMTGELQGDFVVFLIGMRFNRPWKIHKWLPVIRSMVTMLEELATRKESSLLVLEVDLDGAREPCSRKTRRTILREQRTRGAISLVP